MVRNLLAPASRADLRRFGSALALTLTAGGLLLVAVACGDASEGRNRDTATTVSGVTDVTVNDNYFDSASISVPVGSTVTWTWAGSADHNVVGGGMESPVQDSGAFASTFDSAGTVDYECTLHPGMTGEVIVTES